MGAELEKTLVEKSRNVEAIRVLGDSKIAIITTNKVVTSVSQRNEGKGIEVRTVLELLLAAERRRG